MSVEDTAQTTETAQADAGEAQATPENEQAQSQESNQAEATQAEAQSQSESKDAGDKYPSGPPKEERLADIIEKEHALLEEGKDVSKELSADELDLLDEFYAGKVKPKKKAEAKAEEEGDEKPEEEGESKEDAEEPEKNDESEIESDDVEMSSVDIQLMKEVGAKSKGEMLKKIKGLRKAVSGKVEAAPEFKQLKKDRDTFYTAIQNEMKLFDDARAGKPEALAHIEKSYKLKLVPENSSTETTSTTPEKSEGRPKIDKDKFIDSDAADEVNNVINALFDKVESLEKAAKDRTAERNTEKKASTVRKVNNDIIDEMVNVSEHLPKLRKIENIREVITKNLEKMKNGGQTDPRLEYFNDLFEIGNSKKVDLMTALEIDRGRKAALQIAKAKDEGKKEVYEKKANKSLSDLQGRGGDYSKYTEEEVDRMIKTGNMPDEWFNKNDEPDRSKIPKKFHKHFFVT